MKALRPAILTAALTAAWPAAAQVVPVTEAGGYQIMHEESQKVCFAAAELMSEAEKPMIYAYYATAEGRRWNVAGYASATEIDDGTIKVTVSVDGTDTVSRETQTRGSDFLFPFETLAEVEAHEALIATGDVMSITLDNVDTLQVPLGDHRIALEAMAGCLATL